MLRINYVSKMYKLWQIGGTTLRDELQRLNARIRGREDPTKRIGARDYNKEETFMALDGVSFEVKKPDRSIIGTACCFGINSEKDKLTDEATVALDVSSLVPGRYASILTLFTKNTFGLNTNLDCVRSLDFELFGGNSDLVWDIFNWGNVRFHDMMLE